jgi:phosphoglycerate kinase
MQEIPDYYLGDDSMTMKYINELPIDGKRVFIRVDFNVPIKEGKIKDDTRIRSALPTIEYALSRNAKVILASHLGRPKGDGFEEKYSLAPVADRLSSIFPDRKVIFPEDCVGDAVKKLSKEMEPGDIMLLENLRFHAEEEKNDEKFSKELASLADVYINDAFGTAHRAHASTAGMAKFVEYKGAGFLMKKEVESLSKLLSSPERPFVAILGGAKVSDKIAVIENLLNLVDKLVIGGGMAYTFLKAQGHTIGKSLFEEDKLFTANKIIERAKTKGIPLLLPVDNIVAGEISDTAKAMVTKDADVPDQMMGLDVGPKTIALFEDAIKTAKTIFWNGPLGVFETEQFSKGTMEMARAVASSKAMSVVGGGDSVTAVNKAKVADKITHISTGGGASLEFVEGKKLPGLVALDM